MPLKSKSETVNTEAGVQAESTPTGWLGNLLVEYSVTANKDTTIQPMSSADGGSFTTTGDKYSTDDGETVKYWVYDGEYQQTALLLEETGTDTATVAYNAYSPYVVPSEVRKEIKVQSSEYADKDLMLLIHKAMGEIHARTGRVWWGAETVTDKVITAIGDDNQITLPNADIQSITAFSIDDNEDGTFTDITLTSLLWNPQGVVQLSDSSEVSEFPGEPGRVKASYTYGNSYPTEEVRRLTISVVKRLLTDDTDLDNMIERTYRRLSSNNYIII